MKINSFFCYGKLKFVCFVKSCIRWFVKEILFKEIGFLEKDDRYYFLSTLIEITSIRELQICICDMFCIDFDAMNQHRDQFFSTPDRDNDRINYDCAGVIRDGWWYGHPQGNVDCDDCRFNSPNIGTTTYPYPYWHYLPGSDSLMYTDIKIRPV